MQLLVQNCFDPSRATEIFSVPKRRIFALPKTVRYRNKCGLQYARTSQSAENPNFDYPFLTNLRLGTPDYTGSSLQVSQTSPNADLSPHSLNSLGSQSTKSCLQNCGLTNVLLTSARCSLHDQNKAFFLLGLWIEQRGECSRRKPCSPQAFLRRERCLDS